MRGQGWQDKEPHHGADHAREDHHGEEGSGGHLNSVETSGRVDLNHRPHGPEPCTLTWLSYAPIGECQ